MTKDQLEQMKNIDVRTVDSSMLVERNTIHIDESLPREKRLREYVRQIRNPYCYLDNGVVVKISFSDGKETIEDRLTSYLRNC